MLKKQVSLRGLLEFTAGCGFLFAVGPSGDAILNGIVLAALAIWSLRISRWAVRWMLFNWLAASSSLCFGVACLERAFLGAEAGNDPASYWMMCGYGLIVWTPLGALNGLLFLAELLHWNWRGKAEPRFRRDTSA